MLSTFLLTSYRELQTFKPARVRLSRIGQKSLEVEGIHTTRCIVVEVAPTDPKPDRTFSGKLRLRVADQESQAATGKKQISFLEGANRVLQVIRPLPCSSKLIAEPQSLEVNDSHSAPVEPGDADEAEFNRIVDNIKDIGGIITLCSRGSRLRVDGLSELTDGRVGPQPFALSLLQVDKGIYPEWYKGAAKATISQLQFWILEGLRDISYSEQPTTEKPAVIRELLEWLLKYLEPMMLTVVQPVLGSRATVANLPIARKCKRAFDYLKALLQSPVIPADKSELRKCLQTDWIECFVCLVQTNLQLIQQSYSHEKANNSLYYQKATGSKYYFLNPASELVLFENMARECWCFQAEDEDNILIRGRFVEPPIRTRFFDISCKDYNQILITQRNESVSTEIPPKRLVVHMGGETFTKFNAIANENHVVVFDHYHSRMWWVKSSAVFAQLQELQGNVDEKQLSASKLFQSTELSDGFDIWRYREASGTDWSFVQHGVVQIHTPSQFVSEGYDEYETYVPNSRPCTMKYFHLPQAQEGLHVSSFNLSEVILHEGKAKMESFNLMPPSIVLQGRNQFLLAMIELGHSNRIAEEQFNLYLAKFEVKEMSAVLIQKSAFSVLLPDFVLLNVQPTVGSDPFGGMKVSHHWLQRHQKYFSVVVLRSQKYCLWTHVLHNDRFVPVGRKQTPVPGLTQLKANQGMEIWDGSATTPQTVFTERLVLRASNKTLFRVFALTLKW